MKAIIIKSLLFFCFLQSAAVAVKAQKSPAEKEITSAMDMAAVAWNKGDLDAYMSLYDSSATMMFKTGRIGLDSIRALYVKYYFVNGMPKQELSYDNYQLTMLGNDYALLTGTFKLKATEKLPERRGTFSLIFVYRSHQWKLFHDHSG
jgi:ketosteroid isomerase-like protein